MARRFGSDLVVLEKADDPTATCVELDLYATGDAATAGETRVRVRHHCH
jgi:hypothetical protein